MREVHYSNKTIGTTATLIPGNSAYPRLISAPRELWVGDGTVTPATGESVAAGEVYTIPAGETKYAVGRVDVIADIRELRYDSELDARVAAVLATQGAAVNVPLLSTYAPHALTTGVEVYKPEGLRRWWAALAGALNGTAIIECVGDSTVAGTGCDDIGTLNPPGSAISDVKSWPAQLRRLFAATYGDPGRGYVRVDDDRVSLSSATRSTATSIGIYGGYVAATTGQSSTWTLEACTTIDIHWWTNTTSPTSGAFEWSVDGGGTTAVDPGTAANTYGVTTITGLSDEAHTLTIAGTGANAAYIVGVVGHRDSGVLVHRVGVGGRTTYQALGKDVTADAGRLASWKVASYQQLNPDLLVVMIGHNDWAQQNNASYSTPSPAEYAANVQEIITSAVAGGACVLLVAQTPPPAAQTVASGTEVYTKAEYNAALRALATDNDHVAYLSLADFYGTNEAAAALGFQISASVHANSRGYGDIARVVHRALAAPGARA